MRLLKHTQGSAWHQVVPFFRNKNGAPLPTSSSSVASAGSCSRFYDLSYGTSQIKQSHSHSTLKIQNHYLQIKPFYALRKPNHGLHVSKQLSAPLRSVCRGCSPGQRPRPDLAKSLSVGVLSAPGLGKATLEPA